MNGSRLTGLTCSKAPGFWMVDHQLVQVACKCKTVNSNTWHETRDLLFVTKTVAQPIDSNS